MGRFVSTLTFDHNTNLNCIFRNWHSAKEEERLLHGCSINIKLVFESMNLNENNENLEHTLIHDIEQYVHNEFYYTTIIGVDDPELDQFQKLNDSGLIKLRIKPSVGFDRFAELIFYDIKKIIETNNIIRFNLKTVEVRAHTGASSLYIE